MSAIVLPGLGFGPVIGGAAPPAVADGTNLREEFSQVLPDTVWTFAHNWGVRPTSVIPVDSANTVLELPESITITNTTVTVVFGSPTSGTLIIGG